MPRRNAFLLRHGVRYADLSFLRGANVVRRRGGKNSPGVPQTLLRRGLKYPLAEGKSGRLRTDIVRKRADFKVSCEHIGYELPKGKPRFRSLTPESCQRFRIQKQGNPYKLHNRQGLAENCSPRPPISNLFQNPASFFQNQTSRYEIGQKMDLGQKNGPFSGAAAGARTRQIMLRIPRSPTNPHFRSRPVKSRPPRPRPGCLPRGKCPRACPLRPDL